MQRYWLPNGETLGPMQLSHISGLNCVMHMLWEIADWREKYGAKAEAAE
jgi:hypothetical protein